MTFFSRLLVSSASTLAGTLLFSAYAAANQYSYASFSVPGSSYTELHDINDSGQMIGYANSIGGFIFSAGVITPFGISNAIPWGINNYGDIVGQYSDASGIHAFVKYHTGLFSALAIPLTDVNFSVAYDINDMGQIVGDYYTGAPKGASGFLTSNGAFTFIDYPGGGYTQPFGINNLGQVTGGGGPKGGFLGDQTGSVTFIDGGGGNLRINDAGLIVGDWGVRSPNGDIQTLNVSGIPLGINSVGVLVGIYRTGSGSFVASPVPELSSLVLFILGFIPLSLARMRLSHAIDFLLAMRNALGKRNGLSTARSP